MKLSFLGATETVTGSKYLLQEDDTHYLIDCGLFQGHKELRERNWHPLPIKASKIKAVLLTHAHLDHSGYLPLLVKNGFRGPIYASHGTRDLCEIILRDSGHIQEEDAKFANRHGYTKHKPALPLYTKEDVEMTLKRFHTVPFDKELPLRKGFTFKLTHSGHLVGSAFITLKNEHTTLVFSGDVGRLNDAIMRPPERIPFADYLVLESTYGDRLHPKGDISAHLAEVINTTIAKGGSIVIPAFAVGRSQTVLYDIYKLKQEKRIPGNIPVYLDSPMAENAAPLLCKYANEHSLAEGVCSTFSSSAEYLRTPEDSKKINTLTTPCIIISASGMAEGGRVLHHIKHYAPDPKNTILFSGFQAGGTRGARMLNGEPEVKIHGKLVPIKARVERLTELSSHADYEELLIWLKGFESPPKEVFITHGEPTAAEALKEKIQSAFGWNVTVPHYLDTFDLP